MNERLQFIAAVHKKASSFSSICSAFGIAPKTGYKWLHHFESAGINGLRDGSRRPHGNSRAIAADVAERLLQLRRQRPTYGPRKLVAWLEANEPAWDVPAPSTVGELLKRHGLVAPQSAAAPTASSA
jgi:putative transposase